MSELSATQSHVALTASFDDLLCQSAREVFEMMIGMALERSPIVPPEDPGEFAAVIGLAGQISGVFALRCPHPLATAIAVGMLGLQAEPERAEVWDALGESCNMVIGNFKHRLGKAGAASMLTLPIVISGHDYRVLPLTHGAVAQGSMKAACGVLHLRLDYKTG